MSDLVPVKSAANHTKQGMCGSCCNFDCNCTLSPNVAPSRGRVVLHPPPPWPPEEVPSLVFAVSVQIIIRYMYRVTTLAVQALAVVVQTTVDCVCRRCGFCCVGDRGGGEGEQKKRKSVGSLVVKTNTPCSYGCCFLFSTKSTTTPFKRSVPKGSLKRPPFEIFAQAGCSPYRLSP